MKIFQLLFALLLLASCSSTDNRSLNDFVSAFLNENKTIVAFGRVDLNKILEKTQYKAIPKLGIVLNKELQAYGKSLNMETPVYFAFEGPFDQDGTPATTYAFFDVVNKDSLTDKLMQQGFDVENSGDLSFFQSGDVSFGCNKQVAVLISKKIEFDGKKELEKVFDKISDDLSSDKVNTILTSAGDVVFGVNMENLYGIGNDELNQLSKETKEKINTLVTDSYVQSSLNFQNGAVVLETKNYFNDELMQRMFFKSDNQAKIVSKLGTGKPLVGFTMNLDMKKLQGLMNEFVPNALDGLAESMGGAAAFVMAAGGEALLPNLLSGEVGAVLVGQPTEEEGISDFNFYIGLGPKGKLFATEAKNFLSMGMARVDLTDKGIAGYSSVNYLPVPGKAMQLPTGCEGFGKKGITAFVNLEGADLSSFDLDQKETRIVQLLKYVWFEMDENGSKMILKAKDGKENILKQAVDVIIEEFSAELSNMGV